jgi:hypothetical protein
MVTYPGLPAKLHSWQVSYFTKKDQVSQTFVLIQPSPGLSSARIDIVYFQPQFYPNTVDLIQIVSTYLLTGLQKPGKVW